jgi:sulfonate transport system substrate-binding protein
MTRSARAATRRMTRVARFFGDWAAVWCAFWCLACRREALDRADAFSTPPWAALRAADQSGLSRGALLLAGGLDPPYPIEWSTFPSGPPLLEALAADAADLGPVGDSPPIFAQAAGAKIRIVAVTRNSPRYEVLLAPAGSTLRTVADLKGKRIAVAKGSGAHHLLLAALHREGLSMADIQAVYLSPTDAQPAFASGAVDAWAVWDPYAANNLRAGARKLTDGEGLIQGLGFQVSSESALTNPSKVRTIGEFLRRTRRAQTWINSHRDAWAEKYAELTKLSLDVTRDMFDHYAPVYVPMDDEVMRQQQELADDFFAAGLIPSRLDVRKVFDTRFDALLYGP